MPRKSLDTSWNDQRSGLLGWVGFITRPGCLTASAEFEAEPQGLQSAKNGPTSNHSNAVIQLPRMYATALYSAVTFLTLHLILVGIGVDMPETHA